LAHHTLIGFDQETAFIRNARKALPALNREMFSLRTDNDLAQLALIRAGAGIGGCQVPIAKRSDTLIRVLQRQISFSLETWITMHEDLRNRPSCRVVFEALVSGLHQHIASA
jgi:DNA-binding transcriptional LysR family regulator